MSLVVRYTEEQVGESLPFSVTVSGDHNAAQLPRNHPDWTAWGIDVLETEGKILPYVDDEDDSHLTEDEKIHRRREDAKVTRDLTIESPITALGGSWQVHVIRDEPRINRAINTAKAANYPADFQIEWILTDNTTRPTTAAELQQILVAKALREKDIFDQYKVWLADGMIDDFVPKLKEEYLDVLSES